MTLRKKLTKKLRKRLISGHAVADDPDPAAKKVPWGLYPPIWRKPVRVLWMPSRLWHVALECGHVTYKRFVLFRVNSQRCRVCEALRVERGDPPQTWFEGDPGEPLPDRLFVSQFGDVAEHLADDETDPRSRSVPNRAASGDAGREDAGASSERGLHLSRQGRLRHPRPQPADVSGDGLSGDRAACPLDAGPQAGRQRQVADGDLAPRS